MTILGVRNKTDQNKLGWYRLIQLFNIQIMQNHFRQVKLFCWKADIGSGLDDLQQLSLLCHYKQTLPVLDSTCT